MSQQVSLPSLPYILFKNILHKMKTIALMRMRLTCSMINSHVEKNRKKFASRPYLGITLKLFLNRKDFQIEIYNVNRYKSDILIAITKAYDENLENKFSGVSFKHIHLVGEDYGIFLNDTNVCQILMNIFGQLKPLCLDVDIKCMTLSSIMSVTDEMEVVDEISVQHNRGLEYADVFFTKLAEAKNCSKFKVSTGTSYEERTFDMIKHFKGVRIDVTQEGLESILWRIYNLNEVISLKTMSLDRRSKSRNDVFPFTSAPVPPIRSIPKPAFIEDEGILVDIHLMKLPDLPSHVVLIVVGQQHYGYLEVFDLIIVERSSTLVLKIIKQWYPPKSQDQDELLSSIASSFC